MLHLRARQEAKKGPEKCPLDAHTAADLPLCSEHVVLPQKDALLHTEDGSP